ncbi:CheY-like chemotaxis protein [Bradyrhizobium sp. LB13.1]
MSRSQLVAEHLPLLRRYARALTGSQSSGDAYVAAMLEAMLGDPSVLDESHGPRAGLFRLFTQIWNSVSVNDDSEVTNLPMPPERRLSNITPLPRQAFLLLSLEGFSEEEVGYILGTDVSETRRLADAAGREMAVEIATDVLIIEDETFIAMDLESLVKNLGHNVVGVARTHADAVALAKNKRPGLILADIQLADGSSGLDAVNELLPYLRSAGGVHHRVPGTLPHRRAPRAGVPDLKTVPAGDGVGGGEPGPVLPAQLPQPRPESTGGVRKAPAPGI